MDYKIIEELFPEAVVAQFHVETGSAKAFPITDWDKEYNKSEGWNTYFHGAVSSCKTKKGTKNDIQGSKWIWVDIDLPKDPSANLSEERNRILNSLTDKRPGKLPEPSFIVFSGNGYQAWWQLDQMIQPAYVEELNAGLQKLLHGDEACVEASHVMRMPGTTNWPTKSKKLLGRVPSDAFIIQAYNKKNVYSPTQFSRETPKARITAGEETDYSGVVPVLSNDLIFIKHARTKFLVAFGYPAKNMKEWEDNQYGREDDPDPSDRNRWCFRAIIALIRQGVSDEIILGLICKDSCWKVKEHIQDQPKPRKYAYRQLTNAHKWVEDHPSLDDDLPAFLVIEEDDEPMPANARVATPTFPVDVFPPAVKGMVLATAEFCQVPITLASMMALQAIMVAGQHKNVMVANDWEPPCVMQSILVAAPSERKSPVFKLMFKPIRDWEKESRKVYEESLASALDIEDNKESKAAIKRIKPKQKRLLGDVTPEECIRQLKENNECLALCSDEGDLIKPFAGRYSVNGQANLGPILNGWDCGYLPYNRVGSGGGKDRVDCSLDEPRLGIAMAAQYSVLDELLSTQVLREKGVLARMLYVRIPSRNSERALNPAQINQAFKNDYNRILLNLLTDSNEEVLRLQNCKDQGNGWYNPQWVQDLRARLETGILHEGEFNRMQDWAGKLVDNMARIAGVLEHIGGGGEDNLVKLGEFFITHAKSVLDQTNSSAPAVGTRDDRATELLEKIVNKINKKPDPKSLPARKVTVREIQRMQSKFKGEEVKNLINCLVEQGHMKEDLEVAVMANSTGNKDYARKWIVLTSALTIDFKSTRIDDMTKGAPPPPAAEEYDYSYFSKEPF